MKIKHFLLAVLLLLSTFTCLGGDPPDLATIKKQLIEYHDSGEYYRQIDAVIKEAVYYLQFRLNQNARLKNQMKLAIVLDIDETALSNYTDMLHLNFGGTLEEINDLANDGHNTAIPGIKALYNFASQHHVAVFFVTGRKEYQREATERNLKTVGYAHWDGLFMKANDSQQPLSLFKAVMRKQIIKMGYDIVLNIGDQLSDLDGGYADMNFKLPNPYYRIN
jgi:predicted secreted acid phosphatase